MTPHNCPALAVPEPKHQLNLWAHVEKNALPGVLTQAILTYSKGLR